MAPYSLEHVYFDNDSRNSLQIIWKKYMTQHNNNDRSVVQV